MEIKKPDELRCFLNTAESIIGIEGSEKEIVVFDSNSSLILPVNKSGEIPLFHFKKEEVKNALKEAGEVEISPLENAIALNGTVIPAVGFLNVSAMKNIFTCSAKTWNEAIASHSSLRLRVYSRTKGIVAFLPETLKEDAFYVERQLANISAVKIALQKQFLREVLTGDKYCKDDVTVQTREEEAVTIIEASAEGAEYQAIAFAFALPEIYDKIALARCEGVVLVSESSEMTESPSPMDSKIDRFLAQFTHEILLPDEWMRPVESEVEIFVTGRFIQIQIGGGVSLTRSRVPQKESPLLECTISSGHLAKYLPFVKRAVATHPTHPVLGNILLQSMGSDRVLMMGTDLSFWAKVCLPARVIREGKLCLPTAIGKAIPKQETAIVLVQEKGDEDSFLVSAKFSEAETFQFRSLDPEEFPDISLVDPKCVEISAAIFKKGLQVLPFTSPEEDKQVLTGVNLRQEGNTLYFAATDSYRLGVVSLPAPDGLSLEEKLRKPIEDNQKALEQEKSEPEDAGETDDIPEPMEDLTFSTPGLKAIEPLLEEGNVTLKWDNNYYSLQYGEYEIIARRLEGAYPKYWQFVPQRFQSRIYFSRLDALEVCHRARGLADSPNNVIRMVFENGQGKILVHSEDLGEAQIGFEAAINIFDEEVQEPIEMAFNLRHLQQGLGFFEETELTLSLNNRTHPAILTASDEALYLIMPVQMKG